MNYSLCIVPYLNILLHYIFEIVHNLTSKEEIAGKLGELLKDGRLSNQILEFIKYKFNNMESYTFPNISKEIFNIMLQDGFSYYTRGKYRNIIEKDGKIFSNMLEIVNLWNSRLGEVSIKIVSCLQCNRENKLNLKGLQLIKKGSNLGTLSPLPWDEVLYGSYLEKINLRGVYLHGADLSGANLAGVDLSGADLSEAILIKTNLGKANLCRINLSGANLSEANLKGADLKARI